MSEFITIKGTYHLFGCDIMFDTNETAWFLEINIYPALHLFTPTK